VSGDGAPSIPDALDRFEHFGRAGRDVWEEIQLSAEERE